jgi:N-acetylmuramic acid 6-phosphate etherase
MNTQNNDLDLLSIDNILNKMLFQQITAAKNIKKNIEDLEPIIEQCLEQLKNEGRFIFVGAGTSGRIAAQEACELYPTFSWPKDKSLFLIAGGINALKNAQEGAEDNITQAEIDAHKINITKHDIVICLSASGITPYTLAILKIANEKNAYTIGISCNKNSELLSKSIKQIYLNTEKEIIDGSSRLAAGTAQKIILNMLTTSIMIKLNRVYKSYMVDLAVTNNKLQNRAIKIVSEICHVDKETAAKALLQSKNQIKLACVFLKCGNMEQARIILRERNNNLRACLE